jgi:hypothetical protein
MRPPSSPALQRAHGSWTERPAIVASPPA